jgi:drug/metabolite transporter (DMT)-like permease
MNSARSVRVPFKHFLLLTILAAIWSSSFMVIKITVETVPPLTLTAGRLVLAGLMLGVVMIVKSERLPRDRRVWKMCVLLGIFGNALPFTLISLGETGVTSSQASILMAVMPLATVLMAHFFTENERATRHALIGVLIGFTGIVILVGPSALKGLGGNIWFQLSVSGGAISYAVAAVMAKNMPPSSLLGRSVAVMICASVMMVLASIVFDNPLEINPSASEVWGTVYLGILPTGVATLIYFQLISAQGAGFLAYINYLIPVMGVMWGALFLNETITAQALMALGIITLGLFVANYRSGGSGKPGEE